MQLKLKLQLTTVTILTIFIGMSNLCLAQKPEHFRHITPNDSLFMYTNTYPILFRGAVATSSSYLYAVSPNAYLASNTGICEIDWKNNNLTIYGSDIKIKENPDPRDEGTYHYLLRDIKEHKNGEFWINKELRGDLVDDRRGIPGFLVFKPKTDSTDIEFLRFYSERNIKNFRKLTYSSDVERFRSTIMGFCFDETKEYVYYYHSYNHISKMRTDNPDSVEITYIIPDNMFVGLFAFTFLPNMELDAEGKIWWWSHLNKGSIVNFDTKNETFTLYHSEDLLKEDTTQIMDYYNYIYLSEKYNNAVVFVGNNRVTFYPYFYDSSFGANIRIPILTSKVLIYENNRWDSIALPYDLLIRNINGKNYQTMYLADVFHWSENEIAFRVNDGIIIHDDDAKIPGHLVEYCLLIYNLDTKEWKKFVAPRYHNRLFGCYGAWSYGATPPIVNVTIWNDKQCLTLDYGLGIVKYDTTLTNVAENIERFVRLFIDNVYPNPVISGISGKQITAEIGCYVTDIKTVELGLYDFMGKKVLDLTDRFEYYPETSAIYTTFDVSDLTKGTYFLVIKSGSESRAKGIVIGN